LRRFKIDTVLRVVDFVFRPVPFDPHVYLQYSPYDCVKPIRQCRSAKVKV
jgi:hypothetical protein